MDKREYHLSYVPELDGIRAFAILSVMIFHTGIPCFKGGFIGVDIFFVLSGFLITFLLVQEYDKYGRINLKHFYIRRVLRLAPALIALLTAIALLSFFLPFDQAKENIKSIFIALFYSSNWVRAFNLHQMGILNHSWSLSIEEQFYILWPALLIALLKIKSRKKLILVIAFIGISSWLLRIILLIGGSAVERLYNGLDTRADALLTGCVLGVACSSKMIKIKNIERLRVIRYMAAAALICYSAILFSVSWRNLQMYYWLNVAVQVLTAFLILHVVSPGKSPIKRLLSLKPVVWIGSISYGLYLWHDPVYETIRSLGYSQWVIASAGTIITFFAASLSFYAIEKPALRLKAKLNTAGKLKEKPEFENSALTQ